MEKENKTSNFEKELNTKNEDDKTIDKAAIEILKKYKKAFEELAK